MHVAPTKKGPRLHKTVVQFFSFAVSLVAAVVAEGGERDVSGTSGLRPAVRRCRPRDGRTSGCGARAGVRGELGGHGAPLV